MGPLRKLVAVAALGTVAQAVALHLFRRRRRLHAGRRRHFLATQGGLCLRASADEIADAVVSVMMGGIVLDLRHAGTVPRPARLDILCVMGGVQLVVPQDWHVRIEMEAAMGGIRDGRAAAPALDRPPDLLLSGRVVMGGLELLGEMPAQAFPAG